MADPSPPPSPPSTGTTSPRRRRARNEAPHIRHVQEHMERLAHGMAAVPNPEEIFLGADEGDHFLEVVGLRLQGNPVVVLAALRFHRHELPGEEYARESLTAYFSSPPPPSPSSHHAARRGEVTVYLPRWHESVPTFLARLRAGAHYAPVHFSPDLVQVAFDFRLKNPAGMETGKRRAGPMVPHLFRTTAGHVLRGRSHGRSRKPGDDRFIAVTGCEQLTPKGVIQLPSVMLHRDFVAMAVPLVDEKTRLSAPQWTPFLPGTGTKRHLILG